MAKRTASARWDGTLTEGGGTMEFGSGAFSGSYSAESRFEETKQTCPVSKVLAGVGEVNIDARLEA